MPIKFRCPHCQQLLGISRSRAAALVDCPQCGRSLRVPSLDGTVQQVPNAEESIRDDDALRSALTQLSELAQPVPEPASPTSADISESQPDREAESESGRRVISVEPLPATTVIPAKPPQPADDQAVPPATANPQQQTDSTADPLQLLAGSLNPAEESAAELEAESAADIPGLMWWTAAVLVAVLSLSGGWWIGKSRSTDARNQNAAIPAAAVDDAAAAADSQADSPVTVADQVTVQGKVTYLDSGGEPLPDESALVILLPEPRQGSLLLNARSLRRPTDHPDFRATAAALAALGGSLTAADAQGQFSLTADRNNSYVLVAVSRHVQRPPDQLVPADVQQHLTSYFDSLNHLPGMLMAAVISVQFDDSAASVDVSLPAFERNPRRP